MYLTEYSLSDFLTSANEKTDSSLTEMGNYSREYKQQPSKQKYLYISDKQTEIKHLKIQDQFQDCHQSIIERVKHEGVQLIWVPQYGRLSNQLTKKGSAHPFTGPEPAYSTSEKAVKYAIRSWIGLTENTRNMAVNTCKELSRLLCKKTMEAK
jgi:tRNA nucleotidyltransferase (CCA-adding enzyme)